ncbi:radical SAM protein [Thiorhodococcus mannitoliphagus]|uniref:radical SAM protein n=1 Tax=Thiorhodococcus mannitoliphagus TaxID=329406 RepID=UPI0030B90976
MNGQVAARTTTWHLALGRLGDSQCTPLCALEVEGWRSTAEGGGAHGCRVWLTALPRSRPRLLRRSSAAHNHKEDRALNDDLPIRYIEPVYRPPSEADSLILPVTDGCSWNKCSFCEMYSPPHKRFRARDQAEVLTSIRLCGERLGDSVRRVFLADGDALALPTRSLMGYLSAIRQHLSAVRRVSSYCLARNLRKKSLQELRELRDLGLERVYLGAESGDDTVLARVNKGETFESTREALDKLGAAGIRRSVMILNGLGGVALSRLHAENSARLINATQPEYLSTLVVMLADGGARYRERWPDWQPLGQDGLLAEMEMFLSALELRRTIFRADHASNWLVLKGTLGADKARLLQQVRAAITRPEAAPLRAAWMRGL